MRLPDLLQGFMGVQSGPAAQSFSAINAKRSQGRSAWPMSPMNRTRALIICTRPQDYAPRRICGKRPGIRSTGVTEEENRLATEWLRSKRDHNDQDVSRDPGHSRRATERGDVTPHHDERLYAVMVHAGLPPLVRQVYSREQEPKLARSSSITYAFLTHKEVANGLAQGATRQYPSRS